jgi:branched-chain amino acid transport system substrate-binding protein
MKIFKSVLLGACAAGRGLGVQAQEQFIPVLSYRVGPYAAGGSGYYGGAIDYWTLINMSGRHQRREAHVGGVRDGVQRVEGRRVLRAAQEEERRRDDRRALVHGIAYGLFDRVAQDKIPMTTFGYGLASAADGRVYDWVFPIGTTYWDQMAAMIAYLGQKVGGLEKLKGKKIAFLYHDSAYGKEPIPVLDALSQKLGFDTLKIPVTPPGQTMESQWLQIRQASPTS